MPTTDFQATSTYASISGLLSTTYSVTRSTASSFSTGTVPTIGQRYKASAPNKGYYVSRAFLAFDTSAIGGDVVSQVNLKLTVTNDLSATDFDMQIVKCDWSATYPIDSGNQQTAYENCLSSALDDSIFRNTSGVSANTQYTSGNLSTSWINRSGITYYAIMSSLDRSGTAPTATDYISFYQQGYATEAYRPVLTVIHAAGGGASAVPVIMRQYRQRMS